MSRTGRQHRKRAPQKMVATLAVPLLAAALLAACSGSADQPEDDGTLSGCILNRTNATLTEGEADTLRASLVDGFSGADVAVVDNLASFEDLDLAPEAASAVYDAAAACGVDFDAMIATQAFEILGNHGERAQACLSTAATPSNVKEFALAVMGGADPDVTTSGEHPLWMTFRVCEPDATSHTGAAKNDPNNGVLDDAPDSTFPSPLTQPSEAVDPVEACNDYAIEEQAMLLDMLYAGEITDEEYNQMMAQSGADCIDLR